MEEIKIQGARIHNLKNINITIPKQQLVVITGISGSGKSSLAFDIIFEEGKNQYLKSIGILAGLDNEDRFDMMEGIGPTYPEAGVIATSPQTAPTHIPTAEGFPFTTQSVSMKLTAAAAAARFVTTKAFTANAFAASALPALKPNQPNHKTDAPRIT